MTGWACPPWCNLSRGCPDSSPLWSEQGQQQGRADNVWSKHSCQLSARHPNKIVLQHTIKHSSSWHHLCSEHRILFWSSMQGSRARYECSMLLWNQEFWPITNLLEQPLNERIFLWNYFIIYRYLNFSFDPQITSFIFEKMFFLSCCRCHFNIGTNWNAPLISPIYFCIKKFFFVMVKWKAGIYSVYKRKFIMRWNPESHCRCKYWPNVLLTIVCKLISLSSKN